MPTERLCETIAISVLAGFVLNAVLTHVERAHTGMDQKIFDREFDDMVTHYE
jgi:hypothetical protein